MSSSFFKYIEVVLHSQKNWGRIPFKKKWGHLPISKIFEVIFHFLRNILSCHPFSCIEVIFHLKKSSLYSIVKKMRSSFIFKNIWGHLPFSKKYLKLSSIFKNIEVVFHIFSSCVKIRLHTQNQLHKLPGSDLKCNHPWCGVLFLTDNNTTLGDFVLGWPRLWQFVEVVWGSIRLD